MNDEGREHSRGATVRHAGPYADLAVPVSREDLSRDFVVKWIKPFYMTDLVTEGKEFQEAFLKVKEEIDDVLITQLLSEFNWRTRTVGAYFAALKNATRYCDHIGRLLLRSDVCYAGTAYALALARFNTENALAYLQRYLDHYLTRPDLFFDQGDVMGALAYLDAKNNTNIMTSYSDQWNRFIENKQNWNLDRYIDRFAAQIQSIMRVSQCLE